MSNIALKEIDESNFIQCFKLKLAGEQERFVSHPIRSLAQAYVYYSQCIPFGIYDDDKMVGYVMVIYDYDEEVYNIWHMMIDEAFQGKGYGKAALKKVISYISTKPFGKSDTILITCNPENKIAYNLYLQLGFIETGRSDDDEVELGLTLSKGSEILKEKLIKEFNQLCIKDMATVTELHELKGDFVNLEYKLASGQTVKLLDDNKIYYGNEICKPNSDRCYGLVADEKYLLVCEYGNGGSDAEIVVFKRL